MAKNFEVKVIGDNLEKALKKLKSKGLKAGLFKELRARQYYEKPSQTKREKKKEMIANTNKKRKIRERNL